MRPDPKEQEEWCLIPGFEDYSVSSFGRVRRETQNNANNSYPGKIMKLKYTRYISVGLFRNGKQTSQSVHVLVCTAFHGSKPSSEHNVAHWDGDGHNNYYRNVRWVLPVENMDDARRLGRLRKKGMTHNQPVKVEDAQLIRSLRSQGLSYAELVNRFSVSDRSIRKICNMQTYITTDTHERRSIKKRGSNNHNAKLTESDIPIIKALREEGYTYKDLANKFKVNYSQIFRICNGSRWRRI